MKGFELEILSAGDSVAEPAKWQPDGVSYRVVRPSRSKFGIPTLARLLASAILSSFRIRPAIVLGCDCWGNILAALLCRLTGSRHLYYGLELPFEKRPHMSLIARLEHWSVRRADLVVTMDGHHVDFICEQTGASRNRCVFLPVAASGPVNLEKSDVLRSSLGLAQGDVLLLQAGAVGAAQQSLELAEAARLWPHHWHLVLHTHSPADSNPYFQALLQAVGHIENVHVHNQPVARDQLDSLIRSTDIGIAWYDRGLLGFRAELLGLAAGKIGRCLRNGIPVIVPNLSTIREYIEEYQCGVCVNDLTEIPRAAESILRDYERFRANALRCYEQLWRPERYFPEIQQRVSEWFP
jgi:glycosyltransferase involved in cell wall biosynthesis